ncbi:hypothetical protein [Enterococcus ratti]|uniref:Transcriptional regulator n=1 Tax=Enterococcus ratti TaxID=150033 RepID=A0A1L8WPP1_9ENTE|nr:hypothetical protein [Enterococcus ratti]OJG82802.1 hypothetical protein RV14_GL002094 [Enterococcus ratti]
MNFLVVLKDQVIQRSTFLYVQLNEGKTLLHFSPEFHLEGQSLGEIYQSEGLTALLLFFNKELELPVEEYVELSLVSWNKVAAKLFPDGLKIKENDQILHLTVEDLQEEMRYKLDEKDSFSIFQRQQKVLKCFLNKIGKKRYLLKTTQMLNRHPELLHTSIQFTQLFSLIRRFIRLKAVPSRKITLPLENTFRVVKRAHEKKIIVIDFTKNRNVLHQLIMEKAN